MKAMNIYKVHTRMGEYGAPSAKPTWLWSNLPFIADITSFKTCECPGGSNLVGTYVDGQGRTRFNGTPQLKLSQSYPPGFGRALWYPLPVLKLDAWEEVLVACIID
jgi:hypothetical protein